MTSFFIESLYCSFLVVDHSNNDVSILSVLSFIDDNYIVVEAAGISNIRTKGLRTNNPANVVAATMEGLKSLRDASQVAAVRGKTPEEVQVEGGRNMANLRIKLVKSLNGRLDSHIATAQSLGLHKIGNETVQPDNPQTRGKIAKIGYLVQVTEE